MGLELLFLLLPVAAASGWLLGVRSAGERKRRSDPFSRDYYRGLNYLINEQPDKAIEVFIRILEVDSETVETHFALGSLFRRRGEVDRATRIHQNLIARPSLTRDQRNHALFELGRDYMAAGLLDRAESLFEQLMSDSKNGKRALLHLLEIYQQEKEWLKCIEVAGRLAPLSDQPMGTVVGQYYCELAEAAVQRRDMGEGIRLVKRALAEDPDCVRASLIEGELELERGKVKAAIKALKRVEQQDPGYLSEIIEPLKICYTVIGRPDEMADYLRQQLKKNKNVALLLALVDLIQEKNDDEAVALMVNYLHGQPSVRGVDRLIELQLERADVPAKDDLEVLKGLTAKLLEIKPRYRCAQCGFSGRTLHWQCPGCKQWNTVKPIQGIEVETAAPHGREKSLNESVLA